MRKWTDVGIFRRGAKSKSAEGNSPGRAAVDVTEEVASDAEDSGGDGRAATPEGHGGAEAHVSPSFDRSDGPFDRSEVGSSSDHIDLGSLLLLGVEGMQLRLELDPEQTQVVAVTAVLGESSLQLQAFAAPRSGGLWAEIREEIADSVAGRGGTAETAAGRFGTELHTRVPSTDALGRTVFAPARFLGVDGPRWFLRGVLGGRAAVEEDAAAPMLDFFGRTVVVRDGEPMPPRELLALQLPQEQAQGAEGASEPLTDAIGDDGADNTLSTAPTRNDLNPFERGPEITEVR